MSDGNNVVVIFVTTPDAATAASIARKLVEERLIACANIVPGLRSIYRWEGTIEDSAEALMLLKARADDAEAVIGRVKDLHPYSVPEVIVTPVIKGLEDYLDWVNAETDRTDDAG